MSNNLRKIANAAFAAGLVIAGPVAGGIALAPAAQAAAAFCCGVVFSAPTDPSVVTATFKNSASTTVAVQLVYTKAGAVVKTQDVTLPKAISQDGYDANNNWVWGVPSSFPVSITVPAGQTVTAMISGGGNGSAFGSYTNTSTPALPSYQALKPGQVGNVVTVPAAQDGVMYVVSGGAGKPLAPGQQITLTAGQTLTIAAVPTDPPLVKLTGTTSWSYTGVQEGPAELTPQGPTHVSANLYTLPSVTGYHYTVDGKVTSGDFYVQPGGSLVKAVSDHPAQLVLVGQTSWLLDYATPPAPDEGSKKIMICHATGSAKNPYESITISLGALRDPNGHASHPGDIYKGGTYQAASDFVVTIPAHNWNDTTQKIFENNCEVPSSGDTGDHGDHGDHGDTGHDGDGKGGDTGGNTGGTTGGTTTGTTGTVKTPSSNTTPVTTQQPRTQAPVVTSSAPANDEVMKADTAANPTDASNLGVLGGAAAVLTVVGAGLLFRRPKHRA